MLSDHLLALQASLEEPGFCAFLGAKIVTWSEDTQTLGMTLSMKDEFQGGAGPGHMHGGIIGGFIDTAATYALFAAGIESCPTANYRIDMLRPVVNSDLRAEAIVRKRGRRLGTVDVDVMDQNDKLCAIGRATFAILDA